MTSGIAIDVAGSDDIGSAYSEAIPFADIFETNTAETIDDWFGTSFATPEALGKFIQNKDKQFQGGDLNLIHGSRQFLSRSIFPIKPKVGDFYFFPNYLMHSVFPFKKSLEERRSISFNAKIDQSIYNVYE